MGLLDRIPAPKVPATVSDRQMASLRRRAERACTEPMFSPRWLARKRASNDQCNKADRS